MICTINLPPPFSQNAAWANINAKGRRGRTRTEAYRNWIRSGGIYISAQADMLNLSGVKLHFEVDGSLVPANADVSNFIKTYEDLLVKTGVIQNDSSKHVKGVSIEIGDQDRVCIYEAQPRSRMTIGGVND